MLPHLGRRSANSERGGEATPIAFGVDDAAHLHFPAAIFARSSTESKSPTSGSAPGGVEILVSGGTARGTVVGSGGVEVAQSGSVDRAVTISGGFFEVQSGASTGRGAVTFAGSGGLLALDSSVSFDCNQCGPASSGKPKPKTL